MSFDKDIIGREICYSGCLECALGSHSVMSPGKLIYENSLIVVHPHLFVKLKGFIVISPKRHVSHVSELTEQEKYSIGEAIERIKQAFVFNQISENVTVQYVEKDHLEVWVAAQVHPLLENSIDIKKFSSEQAMRYYGITPSTSFEILYVVQILKTYFTAKTFIESNSI